MLDPATPETVAAPEPERGEDAVTDVAAAAPADVQPASVAADVAALPPPPAAIMLATIVPPADFAPLPVPREAQPAAAIPELRGRPAKGGAAAATDRQPFRPEGEPRRVDEASNGNLAPEPAAPAPGAGTEPAPVTTDPAAAVEGATDAPPSLGRDLPAPLPARGAASEPTSAPAPPAPQLQAAVTFAGEAGRVTARLFAHRDDDGSRLTIELNPVELGSVEVALQVDDRGTASATFKVERPETLQLLQRDTRVLIDLLAGAGLALDAGGLAFELRQEQHQARHQHQPAGNHHAAHARADGEGRAAAGLAPAPSRGRGLLDLRV